MWTASPCPSDADYDYASRPQAVKDAMARVSLTGKIKRPLITLHGTDDALLPISTDSDVYDEMVEDQNRARLHRYYTVQGGNHVDFLVKETRSTCGRCCPASGRRSAR